MGESVGRITRRRCFPWQIAVCAVLRLTIASPHRGQADNWIAATGNWFEPANWDAGVPLNTDAVIDNGGTSQVFVPGASAVDAIVGKNSSGTLDIKQAGSLSSWYGSIATAAGSNGKVTVSGAGSTWNNYLDVYIGDRGTGQLNIDDGGAVSSTISHVGYWANSLGTVTVASTNSNWTELERVARWRVRQRQRDCHRRRDRHHALGPNGEVTSLGGEGTMSVTGANSSLATSQLDVGEAGQGSLTISAGGTVSTDATSVSGGSFNGSLPPNKGFLTVTASGSSLHSGTSLIVGEIGEGHLTISAGGSVSTAYGWMGFNPSGTSTVIVTGTGSAWTNTNDLTVGRYSVTALTVADGTTVSSATGNIAIFSGSSGSVTVTGNNSQWPNSGSVYVGGYSSASGGTGKRTDADGSHVEVADTLKLWSTGTLVLAGGSVTTKSLDRTSGTLILNDGTLTVSGGSYTQTSGLLTIDGDAAPGIPRRVRCPRNDKWLDFAVRW